MLSENPIISIFGSSARPQLWHRLLKSLENEPIPFEIVYAGPALINSDSIGIKYYHSYFKPVQCMQYSAIKAKGEYLLHVVDDLIFKGDMPLTNLLNQYNSFKSSITNEVILSTKLMREGVAFDDKNYYLFPNDYDSFIPISIFLKKSHFFNLGGYDKSFITCMADADLIYRSKNLYETKFYFSNTYVEEDKSATKVTLFDIYGKRDLELLISFWFDNKKFVNNLRPKFKPFQRIFLKRNEPNGIWKINSQFFINKLKTVILFYSEFKNKFMKK